MSSRQERRIRRIQGIDRTLPMIGDVWQQRSPLPGQWAVSPLTPDPRGGMSREARELRAKWVQLGHCTVNVQDSVRQAR